eukprot:TRINITY_DN6005_c0_g1_i1.p1 TRINITY_DN6005_c0_g1~~TRINITY_DN6005_c0_g1_i1.p1  ORF type:complete len:1791 (-),score=203.03 TRINITY_DN6005_c0_g1_i1:88-5460(-)
MSTGLQGSNGTQRLVLPLPGRTHPVLKFGLGQSTPHGWSHQRGGSCVNFSLRAPGSSRVWLILTVPGGHPCARLLQFDSSQAEAIVELDPKGNRTGDSWHLEWILPDMMNDQVKGIRYSWLLDPKIDEDGQPLSTAIRTEVTKPPQLFIPGMTHPNFKFGRGQAIPYGRLRKQYQKTVNFSLLAPRSSFAWLVLKVPPDHPCAQLLKLNTIEDEIYVELDPRDNRTGDSWHLEWILPDGSPTDQKLAEGIEYAWLLDPDLDEDGQPLSTATRSKATKPQLLFIPGIDHPVMKFGKGQPRPHGCIQKQYHSFIRFSLLASRSSTAWLVISIAPNKPGAKLLKLDADQEEMYVELDPKANRSGDSWHLEWVMPEVITDEVDQVQVKYAWLLDPDIDEDGQPLLTSARTEANKLPALFIPKRHPVMKFGIGRPMAHSWARKKHGNALNFSLRAPESSSAWLILTVPQGHACAEELLKLGVHQKEVYVQLEAESQTGDTWHVEWFMPDNLKDHVKGIKYEWLVDPELDEDCQPLPTMPRIKPTREPMLFIPGKAHPIMKFGAGKAKPNGCSQTEEGSAVNFSLRAPHSSFAWLLLKVPPTHPFSKLLKLEGKQGEIYVELDPKENRTGDAWHLEWVVPDKAKDQVKGIKYAWLIDPDLDEDGQPLSSHPRAVDPFARVLDSNCAADWNNRPRQKYSPLPVIPDFTLDFDWQGVVSPGLQMEDLIIYEAHVRGFTKNPDSGVQHKGTFLGFIEKIPHLLKLGVNCVEFLPIHEYDETACPLKNPHNGDQLCNYWGYQTVAFFVPMQRFATNNDIGSAIVEFKTLVRELHRNGIEVILDVVFNHTGEGAWGEGNWLSWSQVSKTEYYILSNGYHTNYTGCGNTMNANGSLCCDWICECLRYWVVEMHVDGFRFDLASALTRGSNGVCNIHDPYLIRKMVEDPSLSHVKLIAEPWDCSWPDGQLQGKFPSCGPPRFAEWNGQFRDTMRSFIKGDEGMKSDFATRFCGSSDLFQADGRGPFHSINFITAHDGFTLRDLVSYNKKNNSCCGENSGDDNNHSWNCGQEGKTENKEVQQLREKQMKNFLVALFMSAGTPMMVCGDEYGRTQHGCNNGWNQDSLSWFSWGDLSKQEDSFFRFCRGVISLRKKFGSIFNRTSYWTDHEISWRHDWDNPYNFLCCVLHDRQRPLEAGYRGLLVAFNAGSAPHNCDLPPGLEWHRMIDTNVESPEDVCLDGDSAVQISGETYVMSPYSCIVLQGCQTMQLYEIQVRCDCTLPGEVISIVGSEETLGSWDPARAIQCTSSPDKFPIWTSPLVGVPWSHRKKFEFKILRQSEEGSVVWDEKENRRVVMPEKFGEAERICLHCSWSSATVSGGEPDSDEEMVPAQTGAGGRSDQSFQVSQSQVYADSNLPKEYQEYQFQIFCDSTTLQEVILVVGSEVELGSWQPAKAVRCSTTESEFPIWSSPVLSIPWKSGGEFEFKLLKQGEGGYVVWDDTANHKVEMPATRIEGQLIFPKCAWGIPDLRCSTCMMPAGQMAQERMTASAFAPGQQELDPRLPPPAWPHQQPFGPGARFAPGQQGGVDPRLPPSPGMHQQACGPGARFAPGQQEVDPRLPPPAGSHHQAFAPGARYAPGPQEVDPRLPPSSGMHQQALAHGARFAPGQQEVDSRLPPPAGSHHQAFAPGARYAPGPQEVDPRLPPPSTMHQQASAPGVGFVPNLYEADPHSQPPPRMHQPTFAPGERYYPGQQEVDPRLPMSSYQPKPEPFAPCEAAEPRAEATGFLAAARAVAKRRAAAQRGPH